MIVGIDEVGRGCWAGPLVAAAVLLDEPIAGLKDSKKLSKRSREILDAEVRLHAKAFGIGWVDAAELDEVGLTQAVSLAMQRAITQISAPYTSIVIDGSYNFLPNYPNVQTMVKADDVIPAVSAASIIAKVIRDSYMAQASLRHPGYGFEQHVGYGTALHRAAIESQGICALHRQSFAPIRALAERNEHR